LSRRTFVKETIIYVSPERVLAFYELPDALAPGAELDAAYARKVLEYAQRLWGRPAHLETKADGEPVVMHYDGEDHEED